MTSGYIPQGNESFYRSAATQKIYGTINMDEFLIPFGGGSGGIRGLNNFADFASNVDAALDWMNRYTQNKPVPPSNPRTVDTINPHEKWLYYETIKNGADTPYVYPH